MNTLSEYYDDVRMMGDSLLTNTLTQYNYYAGRHLSDRANASGPTRSGTAALQDLEVLQLL